VVALAFVTFFVFVPQSISGATCGGNYVILNIEPSLHSLYGYYYFGFLLLGIWEALEGIREDNKKRMTKRALFWFIIGYLSFILPLTLVYTFLPMTRIAIASVMCGFAVIFALILAFKIAPIYHESVKVKPKHCKKRQIEVQSKRV
jgi:drug/metabolite transporter (DMT)-like permease